MVFKPGFITPPWPHSPGELISIESIIHDIEKESHHDIEIIYRHRVLRRLDEFHRKLTSNDDIVTFLNIAGEHGFYLSAESLSFASLKFYNLMDQIWRNHKENI
ncbi:TPA: hypothetical protein QHV31_005225 [Klebsiella variicola]|nr:hypothetical protein [Klebsiella variicola]